MGLVTEVRTRSVVQRTVTKDVLNIVVLITTVETGSVVAAVVVIVIRVGATKEGVVVLSPDERAEVLLSLSPCAISAVKDDQIAPSDGIG